MNVPTSMRTIRHLLASFGTLTVALILALSTAACGSDSRPSQDTGGAWRIGRTDGFRASWREIDDLIVEDRERTAANAAAQRRLVQNTGLVGVDETGKQLDQREHLETMEALRWLATCQMGHYRSRGERYHADLMPVVESLSERYGLPTPNGIHLHVSRDGQSWYGERQTITGHWFAIGAAGPPSDQWLYDRPTRSSGYPTSRNGTSGRETSTRSIGLESSYVHLRIEEATVRRQTP